MSNSKDIILYHYAFSPYARRIVWYLNLRKIPYSECKVAAMMPRPAVSLIGTQYRRIPILTIGRDIYLDTRLILSKLESLFPPSPQHPSLSPSNPEHQALRKLLEAWSVDAGGVFVRAAQLLPADLPMMKDRNWLKDREDFTGTSWGKQGSGGARKEALVAMREKWRFLEEGLLADGRMYLGGEEVGMLDLEAVWALHWIRGIPGAIPKELFSPSQFPKVHAWIDRFDHTVTEAAKSLPSPKSLKGPKALKQLEKSTFAENEAEADGSDPLELRKGDEVELFPTDTGFSRKDRGRLVALNEKEIVLDGKTESGVDIRIHAPRHGFKVRTVGKL